MPPPHLAGLQKLFRLTSYHRRCAGYRWKSKYGGLEVSEAKRLKQLEDENSRLKRIVAELTLDVTALKDVLAKK